MKCAGKIPLTVVIGYRRETAASSASRKGMAAVTWSAFESEIWMPFSRLTDGKISCSIFLPQDVDGKLLIFIDYTSMLLADAESTEII